MVHRADEMHMFRILTRFIGVILWSSGGIEIICYFGYKVLSKVVWEGGEIKLQSYWSKSRGDFTMTFCRFSFFNLDIRWSADRYQNEGIFQG